MSNFHNDKRELGKQKREYQGEIQAPRRKHLQARLDKIINYNQNERDFEDYRHETENNEYLPKLHADSGDKRGNEAAEVNEDKAEKKRQRDDTAEPESKKNKCEEETLASDEPDQGYDLPSWVDEVNPKRLSATVLHGYNAFKYMVGETGDSELAQEVSVMAARSRPRNGVVKEDPPDAHEERNMWSSITGDLTKVKSINARAAEVSKAIIEKEKYMHTNFATMQDIDELQAMYRENVKLAAEEQKILNEGPEEVISNIEILKALRNASEIDPTRSGTNAKSRGPKRHPDVASASAESPAPSPNTVSSSAARFKDKVSRSGSVSSLKDNKESLSSSAKLDDMIDGAKGTSAERAGHLFVGAEVAFKQSKQKGQEGDWIQCTILTVTGDTKKRYEVQDPEPDDTGAPGQIYKTSAAALIPIPAAGSPLPEFPKGKQVLARYPETTTFYRAEVVSLRKDVCRLRFEDEDDKDKEMDVDRRYVLDMGGK